MRKYAYITVLALIAGTVIFTSCRRMEQMMDPIMPDAEMIEPPEVGDANALLKYLTIEGATVVNAPLPETSIAQTAPRIQADVTEINASPGGIVSLPFAYSGTNALAGCIVCIEIEGVPGYFNLPYTGAPDDLPSAISVGLPPDVELGTFEVCYSVYDDQGQYSNYLRTVINVKEMPGEAPIEPVVEVVNIDRTDPNALPNRLTIEGATLVSASLPETSTAATAPRLQADITEVNASPGGTIFLPFEYSGANALAGCIVCIEGVPGYYDLPYTGAADALPTAIPVGLSINLELGTFEVCYSVYDDQGQYGNFLTAVINVEAITDDLIPDANLAAAVRETLGLPADALLTAEVLRTLEELEARGREIVDLTGLEHAMNLTYLNLNSNQVSDISVLANLTQLTYLNLNSNQVSDISVLENLTQLTHLDLFNNQVSDISPLANLTQLTNLNLWSNQVSDISPLANLTQLTTLNLEYNQVSDFSVLANLTKLTNLWLENNQVSDISVLANLTQLTTLDLGHNQVSDISPLANLTKLTNLWLENNQVSDISVLANLTKLTHLYLGYNQVSDISVLANLTQLTYLNLNSNQVSDISGLENLTQLTNLYLWNNQVSDISGLENLTQLTILNLGQNQVSDISPLVANTGLDSGDTVRLENNPLNAAAINTHIPALQARGVTVVH